MEYIKNKLGAWQVGDDRSKGKVEFKLFFPKGPDPQIASINVIIDFQDQTHLNPDLISPTGFGLVRKEMEDGTFWTYQTTAKLKSDYYQYQYCVTFTDGTSKMVSDPCARYGGMDSQHAAFVIGGSQPADNLVLPLKSGRKHLRDLIIYELMIDDFTNGYQEAESPLATVVQKLDYIKDLGFNAILFMPWTAWKSRNFDWGYEPFQFFAVEYRYTNSWGKPAEKISWLKKLINECHARDIHVIMDGVFNHVSPDFPYKAMYKATYRNNPNAPDPNDCPYTGIYGGSFPGLQDLNFNNECTNEFILDVCRYWIDTFKIDGIRFDNTTNYHVAGSPNGLDRLLRDIDAYMAGKGEANFSLTLEHIDLSAVSLTNATKATSYWDNAFYSCAFGHLWTNQIDPRLLNALNNQRFLNSVEKVPTIYGSNHDHSHLCWQAGARANAGAANWYKTQPYVIALYTSPATPMIPNGQEFGEDHWIPENDDGTGRRVSSRPLRWKRTEDAVGKTMLQLYKRMGKIRQQYAGLRSANFYPQPWEEGQTQFDPQGYGMDVSRQLAIFHRWGNDEQGNLQRFVIVLNFSDNPQFVSVPFPDNGDWLDLLSVDSGCWEPQITNWRLDFTVGSNWGHVFFK